MYLEKTKKESINFKTFLNLNETIQKKENLAKKLAQICPYPEENHYKALNLGKEIPLNRIQYYHRMASILKKIIENPCGPNKIAKMYKSTKKSSTKPPKYKVSYVKKIKETLEILQDKNLVLHSKKGYYTSKKGKDLLLEIYNKLELKE